MAILDLFRPKWRHSDRMTRIRAVETLTDQAHLAKVASNDDAYKVRAAAVGRLDDQVLLSRIAGNDADPEVRIAAVRRLRDERILADIATNEKHGDVCVAAVLGLSDQAVLAAIARFHGSLQVQEQAIKRLTDQQVILEIIRDSKFRSCREAAVGILNDQVVLADIAKTDKDDLIRRAAIERLTDQRTLAEIAKNDRCIWPHLWQDALRRVSDEGLLVEILQTPFSKHHEHRSDWDQELKEALGKVRRQGLLAVVVKTGAERDIRAAALGRIGESTRSMLEPYVDSSATERVKDQNLLADIAAQSAEESTAVAAAKRITRADVLVRIAKTARNHAARLAAATTSAIRDEALLLDLATTATDARVRAAAVEGLQVVSPRGPIYALELGAGSVWVKAARSLLDDPNFKPENTTQAVRIELVQGKVEPWEIAVAALGAVLIEPWQGDEPMDNIFIDAVSALGKIGTSEAIQAILLAVRRCHLDWFGLAAEEAIEGVLNSKSDALSPEVLGAIAEIEDFKHSESEWYKNPNDSEEAGFYKAYDVVDYSFAKSRQRAEKALGLKKA